MDKQRAQNQRKFEPTEITNYTVSRLSNHCNLITGRDKDKMIVISAGIIIIV